MSKPDAVSLAEAYNSSKSRCIPRIAGSGRPSSVTAGAIGRLMPVISRRESCIASSRSAMAASFDRASALRPFQPVLGHIHPLRQPAPVAERRVVGGNLGVVCGGDAVVDLVLVHVAANGVGRKSVVVAEQLEHVARRVVAEAFQRRDALVQRIRWQPAPGLDLDFTLGNPARQFVQVGIAVARPHLRVQVVERQRGYPLRRGEGVSAAGVRFAQRVEPFAHLDGRPPDGVGGEQRFDQIYIAKLLLFIRIGIREGGNYLKSFLLLPAASWAPASAIYREIYIIYT